jgi:protein TonB
MRPGYVRWLLPCTAAAALHATALIWFGTRAPTPEPLTVGGDAIELTFDVADAAPATVERAPIEPAAAPPKPEPAPAPKPILQRQPETQPAPEPVHQPAPTEPVAAAPSEHAWARPAPANTPGRTVPSAAATAATVTATTTAPAPQRRFTGKPARNVRSYFGQISAWIDASKDYPATCRKHKQQGAVVVRFTIGRDGQLLASAIKQSSGHALLDQAALATLARAAPFPPIPEFVGRERLTIAVPIEYALITD